MAYNRPTSEPTTARAGTSWQWSRTLADWPASVWSLTYRFRNASNHFDVSADAEGDVHIVEIAPAESAVFAPGRYDWFASVTDGVDIHDIAVGSIEVLPDVSASAAYDGRSWARKMLDLVELSLANRASRDQLDMLQAEIEGNRWARDSLDKFGQRGGLLAIRQKLQIEIARQEGRGGPRSVEVRFG